MVEVLFKCARRGLLLRSETNCNLIKLLIHLSGAFTPYFAALVRFEGTLHYRFYKSLGAYAGWGWNKFSAENSFAGKDCDFEETGYVFGLQFNHAIGGFPLSYYVRAGGLWNHIEAENSDGDIIEDTKHGLGFQLAGGIYIPVGKGWNINTGLKLNSLHRKDVEFSDDVKRSLEKMLKELAPDISIAAKLTSVESSVAWLKENSVDLIFLDIQLTDGLSFSIFDRVEVKTPIIFTTAYDQYAIKAFELNSIAYLLKPLKKRELESSLQKYQSLKSAYSIDFDALLSTIKGKTEYKKRFLVQIADRYKKVEAEEIAYFFALEKNVFFKTTEGQTYPLDMTLDQVEKAVDPTLFFRINRKYIVNISAISNMISWSKRRIKVELIPAAESSTDTIVSMERYSEFKKWLDK